MAYRVLEVLHKMKLVFSVSLNFADTALWNRLEDIHGHKWNKNFPRSLEQVFVQMLEYEGETDTDSTSGLQVLPGQLYLLSISFLSQKM